MSNFSLQKKIYYHDTDCGAVVYYGNYLKHLEEARTEFMLHKGVDLKALADKGIFFVVANINVKYKAPARYLDTISITTEVKAIKMSMLFLSHQIFRESQLLVEAEIVLMCVGLDFKPNGIPEAIKKALK